VAITSVSISTWSTVEAGQVTGAWHDMAGRDLISTSLTDFIEIIATDAAAGSLVWDEEMGGVYEAQET